MEVGPHREVAAGKRSTLEVAERTLGRIRNTTGRT